MSDPNATVVPLDVLTIAAIREMPMTPGDRMHIDDELQSPTGCVCGLCRVHNWRDPNVHNDEG